MRLSRPYQYVFVATATCALIAVAVFLGRSHGSGETPARGPEASSAGGPASGSGESAGLVAAAVDDSVCEPLARPDLSGLDGRVKDAAAKVFAADPPHRSVSREAIADHAREFARGGAGGSLADRVAVASVPYSLADRWFGSQNQLVAPRRCVWAVTVYAPFEPLRQPWGAKVRTYNHYSMLFDRATGEQLALVAGEGRPDLVRGTGLDGR